jgi:3-methyl-2-oxobutanoate hydroxymethyltransferase
MEGGAELSETIKFLTERGIIVVGHVGMMPQRSRFYGGFSKQSDVEKIMHDFESISLAGCQLIVIENVIDDVTSTIAKKYPDKITIGIGASMCRGEIAVLEDIINLSGGSVPPFVKIKRDVESILREALSEYSKGL